MQFARVGSVYSSTMKALMCVAMQPGDIQKYTENIHNVGRIGCLENHTRNYQWHGTTLFTSKIFELPGISRILLFLLWSSIGTTTIFTFSLSYI